MKFYHHIMAITFYDFVHYVVCEEHNDATYSSQNKLVSKMQTKYIKSLLWFKHILFIEKICLL